MQKSVIDRGGQRHGHSGEPGPLHRIGFLRLSRLLARTRSRRRWLAGYMGESGADRASRLVLIEAVSQSAGQESFFGLALIDPGIAELAGRIEE
jgi:hypothetical protein